MNPNETIQRIKLADILPSQTNPRQASFNQRPDWPGFVESVKLHGVTQPALARPHPKHKDKYELVAGARRLKASQELALPDLPVIVRALNDEQVIELQQIENLQREDLTPLEEAQGYADWRARLLKAGTMKTVEGAVEYIATKVGRKRSAIYQKLALLKCAPPVRAALQSERLEPSKAALVASIPDVALQAECLENTADMSVRALAEHIAAEYRAPLAKAPFDLKKTYPLAKPESGKGYHEKPCEACPLRSGNMTTQYPELAKTPNICTNPACYADKVRAHMHRVLEQARNEGRPIMTQEEYVRGGYCKTEKAAETCWEDKRKRTYAALARIAKITPTVAIDRNGAALEVFTNADCERIKTANKIKGPSCNSLGQSTAEVKAQKARQVKEKAMVATLTAAIPGLLDKLAPKGVIDPRLWPLLAHRAYHSLSIDHHDFMAKRLGISKRMNDSRAALEKYLKQHATPADSARQVVELLLFSQANGGGWHEVKWDKTVLAAAKLARVNLERPGAAAKLNAARKGGRP